MGSGEEFIPLSPSATLHSKKCLVKYDQKRVKFEQFNSSQGHRTDSGQIDQNILFKPNNQESDQIG